MGGGRVEVTGLVFFFFKGAEQAAVGGTCWGRADHPLAFPGGLSWPTPSGLLVLLLWSPVFGFSYVSAPYSLFTPSLPLTIPFPSLAPLHPFSFLSPGQITFFGPSVHLGPY